MKKRPELKNHLFFQEVHVIQNLMLLVLKDRQKVDFDYLTETFGKGWLLVI
jgi:hypothetical protein